MTEVVRVDPGRPDPAAIARAAACLQRGGLVAFPTETVYGIGVHARDREAVLRLFEAKRRPAHDPLIVHVAEFAQARALVASMPPHTAALAARFWPGPLTLVMPRSPNVPYEVTAGLDTVAVRVPSHPVASALLAAAALPVAAPSANLFSRPSPTRASHVLEDLDGRIDMVIDGGPTQVGVESTVLDLTTDPPMLLRPGAVTAEMLREIVPRLRIATRAATGDEALPSPGLLSKHYAPRAPLTLYRGESAAAQRMLVSDARKARSSGLRVGVLTRTTDAPLLSGLACVMAELGRADDAEAVAARLYQALRELDTAQVDLILARDFAEGGGLWSALRDRLRRAATHVVDADRTG